MDDPEITSNILPCKVAVTGSALVLPLPGIPDDEYLISFWQLKLITETQVSRIA